MFKMMRPASDKELADVLREAAANGTPLEAMGAGSKRAVGRPMQTAANVSTRAMRGVTLYEPSEMVMAAKAGTTLSIIEEELAKNGQMLAFEPPDLAPMLGGEPGQVTVGAVFATNISGARRIHVGAARDHLLGVKAVNGRGEIFASGGRVMKNVTGYDLCRLLAGSWGTLALMTEVSFKVMPRAEETRTLVFLGLPDEIATEVLCGALGTPYEVSGTMHIQAALAKRLWNESLAATGKAVTLLRLENFSRSITYRAERLKSQLAAYGEIHELDHATSLALWSELSKLSFLHGGSNPVWRISTTPEKAPRILTAVRGYMEVSAAYDWSGGLIWLELLPTTDAGSADIRRVVATHGGHATLIRAEPAVRAVVEVFQPLEAGLDRLTRKIKASFDPAGILNPGRMYAGV